MILWIFALGLMAASAMIGYYQGAIRVAFSLVGLLVAALLALPLAGLVKPILPVFGLSHPVLVAFIAPAIVYILVLIIFKCVALVVHRKVETLYKYKRSGTELSLFQRMSGRVGICLGLANATIYVFLVAVVAYFFGYFTFQVSGSDKDSFLLKHLTALNRDMQSMGMTKAVAPFMPSAPLYYDVTDLIGFVFHNPLASQSRLSSYPPFLALTDRPHFKPLDDVKFQQFWLEQHTFGELVNHDKIQPLVESADDYAHLLGLLNWDLKDLMGYLETGSSAKYDEIKILGHWAFDRKESMARVRKSKPNMTLQELRLTRAVMDRMADANFTARIDNKLILKMPAMEANAQTALGSWKENGPGNYTMVLTDRDKKTELQVTAESNKLLVSKDGFSLVFEKY